MKCSSHKLHFLFFSHFDGRLLGRLGLMLQLIQFEQEFLSVVTMLSPNAGR